MLEHESKWCVINMITNIPIKRNLFLKLTPWLLSGILLLPSLYWIYKDHSVWPWDTAWYGEVTVELWYSLINYPAQWLEVMTAAFASKAPFIAWFGQFFVPFGQFFGSIERGLLISILLVQFGSLVLTYQIGKIIVPNSEMAVIAGVVFVGSYPLFVGMTHQYYTEAHQLFSVFYMYWIAAQSSSRNSVHTFFHILLAATIGMLAKISSPLYFAFPMCVSIYYMIKSTSLLTLRTGFKVQDVPLFLTAATIFGFGFGWYKENIKVVLGFAKLASSSEIALDYGKIDTFTNKLIYWGSATQKSFFTPWLGALLLGLVCIAVILLLIKIRREGRFFKITTSSILGVAALLQIIFVLIFFSKSINEDNRYLLALGPSIVIIFFGIMSFVDSRFLRVFLLIAMVSQWVIVNGVALGLTPDLSSISHYVRFPVDDRLRMKEISRIVDLTCTEKTKNRFIMTGVELDWLNYNTLSFYASKTRAGRGFRCYYVYLGHAEKDVNAAWGRFIYYKIAYFISLEETAQVQPPDFINMVSLPILKRVEDDMGFVQEPFMSRFQVVIYRAPNVILPSP